MTITERSSKAEILSAAAELTDHQAARIADLEQRQTILICLLGLVSALLLI